MGVFRNNDPTPAPRSRQVRRRSTTRRSGGLSLTVPNSDVRFSSTRTDPNRSGVSPAPAPYSTVRTLTAAARTINLKDPVEVARMSRKKGGDAWQAEAWEYFDTIGEIGFAFSMLANILSRIRLYAATVEDPSQSPAPVDPDTPGGGAAIAALKRLDSAFGGQPGLLRDAGLNLCVTGECYLVQIPSATFPRPRAESWDIRSTDELSVDQSGNAYLTTSRTQDARAKIKLPDGAYTARIWRPHPRFSDDAQSSMLALLDACAELQLINKTFRATARSRLNAGMLYLPDGLSVSAGADPDVSPEDDPDGEEFAPPAGPEDDTEDFEESLIDAMTTPIADEEAASAVVPLLVRGPAEFADKVRHIKFERSFDPALVARADKVLDRILAGIDVPKDVVAGMANVKYANAAVIDEGLYKAHIEPMAVLLCDALTVVYLHPALKAAGVDPSEIPNYVVWYDPSEVTTKPNKAEDADTGYDKHLLSGSAWRRNHGFGDGDAPTPEEVAIRLLVENPSMTPELSEALLAVYAPEVMKRVREANQADNPAPLPPDVTNALGLGDVPGEEQPPLEDGEPPAPAPALSPTPPPPPAAPSAATPPQTLKPEDLV